MPQVLAPRLEFFRCPTFSFGKKRKRVPETVRVETVQSDTLERLPAPSVSVLPLPANWMPCRPPS
jgi:hypothetical protein